MLEIYTDGSCLKNPGGAGGWAAVILYSDKEVRTLKGGQDSTTNNIMELSGPINALRYVLDEYTGEDVSNIAVYSDSQYVVRGMTSWMKGWVKHNWKTSLGKDVKNLEFWKALNEMSKEFKELGVSIKWVWVKGHSGNKYNEIADKISRQQAEKRKNSSRVIKKSMRGR